MIHILLIRAKSIYNSASQYQVYIVLTVKKF